MALITCPNCGNAVSSKAEKCPRCGLPIKEQTPPLSVLESKIQAEKNTMNESNTTGKKSKTWIVWVVVLSVVLAAGFALFYFKNNAGNTTLEGNAVESQMTISEESHLKNVISFYCRAIVNNDFAELRKLYAPVLERYHSAYNEDRETVVGRHKRYDEVFGVYGKHSSIRWDSFKAAKNEMGYDVVVVEDYRIDRYDKSKMSMFVLEKHFRLNNNYEIVSVWDVQLSKSR